MMTPSDALVAVIRHRSSVVSRLQPGNILSGLVYESDFVDFLERGDA
jgi:hypothetical protein